MLPYNRIGATFELQSNVLIDRMERFVARQEIPYNSIIGIIKNSQSSRISYTYNPSAATSTAQ